MSQITSGIRSILSRPAIYLAFQHLLGARKRYRLIVQDYIDPFPAMKVLDVGCGAGDAVFFLPNVTYHGFDLSAEYIAYAKQKYGHHENCRFFCQHVGKANVESDDKYDVVLAVGLLHHLSDDECLHFFRMGQSRLADGGRLITVDCTLAKGQHPFASMMIKRDRGQNVRPPEGYRDLAMRTFPDVQLEVRHDMMYVPYSEAVLICRD